MTPARDPTACAAPTTSPSPRTASSTSRKTRPSTAVMPTSNMAWRKAPFGNSIPTPAKPSAGHRSTTPSIPMAAVDRPSTRTMRATRLTAGNPQASSMSPTSTATHPALISSPTSRPMALKAAPSPTSTSPRADRSSSCRQRRPSSHRSRPSAMWPLV